MLADKLGVENYYYPWISTDSILLSLDDDTSEAVI